MLLHSTSASASWNAAAVSGRSLPSGDRADRSRSPSGPATSGGPPTSARASRDSGVVAGYGGPPVRHSHSTAAVARSEERRVGKEGRTWWARGHEKKKG